MTRHHPPLAAALVAWACLTAGCGGDTPAHPTASVGTGFISQWPPTAGLAAATPFTFTALGFTTPSGQPLTCAWNFGDGTTLTGGTTVTHTYMYEMNHLFEVSVSAVTAGGATILATLNTVRVRDVTGWWGVRNASGTLVFGSTSLTQNEAALRGDDTRLNCRYEVTGSVSAPRSISLTYTRPPGDCQGSGLPVSLTFSGVADDLINSFTGEMTPGGTATLVRCTEPIVCQ